MFSDCTGAAGADRSATSGRVQWPQNELPLEWFAIIIGHRDEQSESVGRERERRRSRHRYVSWSRRVTKWFSINRSQTRRRCCLKATSVSQSSYFVFKAINTCCLSSTTVVCCPFSDINEIDTRHVVSGKHVVRSMMVQLDKKYWLIGIAISW